MMKTKIIATLGPASSKAEIIDSLIQNNVDIFRLNFSHGSFEDHARLLQTIRQVQSRYPNLTAVMGDLCGPKIRTSSIVPEAQMLHEHDEVVIADNNEPGNVRQFGTNYEHFVHDVRLDDRILIDDGNIMLQVVKKNDSQLQCRVLVPGVISSHKGINLPNTHVNLPSVTPRDWQFIDWAIEHQLNFLALSFVRTADEIKHVKAYLDEKKTDIKVIAKIEKPQAIDNIESIIDASDAVLVARGDLGVEMDMARVPLLQKRITLLCRQHSKPCIVATQMLQSMIERPVPTRAEVSDVANAIMDLTDAVMLSGETAVGQYPIAAAQWMERIAQHTEAFLDQHSEHRPLTKTSEELAMTAAIARSVAEIIDETHTKLVVAWSETGAGARLYSKARIDVPIITFSSNQRVCQQMNLDYGVIPICHPLPDSTEQFIRQAEKIVLEKKWAQPNDHIVIIIGQPLTTAGSQNTVIIHTLPKF